MGNWKNLNEKREEIAGASPIFLRFDTFLGMEKTQLFP
jgi:hypothetical protein